MMTSEEMTERVIKKLNEHREKTNNKNAIFRKADNVKTGYKSGIFALAASMAFIVAATVSAVSLGMNRHAPEPLEDMTEIYTTEVTTTEIATETTVPVIAENNQYHALELHENIMRVYSFDKHHEMILQAYEDYERDGAWLIDREKYIPYIYDENMRNSLEAKSYIYHMMLNSVDYFRTAQGTLKEENMTVDFLTDIAENYSYEEKSDGFINYHYNDWDYMIDVENQKYKKYFNSKVSGFNMNDNDRLIRIEGEGTTDAVNRPDMTNLPLVGNSCLLPQSLAFSRLGHSFDSWRIIGTENILGFECAVIDGIHKNNQFRIYVELEHGILMKYQEEMITEIEVLALELDGEIAKKNPDISGFNEI